jgi:hypothetical protein
VHVPDTLPDAGWHDLEDLIVNGEGWSEGFLLAAPSSSPDPYAAFKQKAMEKIEKALLTTWLQFGGAPFGGSGTMILPGGKPIHIDPHSPAKLPWERMTDAERDLYLGYAIRNLAPLLAGGEREELVKRVAIDVINSATKELEEKNR